MTQSNGLPAVITAPGDPHEAVTTSGCGATFTVAEPVEERPFASVTLNCSLNESLTGSVTVKIPVPVYGWEPPAAETEQLKGFPDVIGATVGRPHDTVTTSG